MTPEGKEVALQVFRCERTWLAYRELSLTHCPTLSETQHTGSSETLRRCPILEPELTNASDRMGAEYNGNVQVSKILWNKEEAVIAADVYTDRLE